jgi:hypothetical protein
MTKENMRRLSRALTREGFEHETQSAYLPRGVSSTQPAIIFPDLTDGLIRYGWACGTLLIRCDTASAESLGKGVVIW